MSETTKPTTVVAAPTRAQFIPLNKVKTLQEMFDHPDFKNRIKQAVPAHMSPERLLRTFVLSASKQPKLAAVSPMSMLGAFITLAALGLEPNTPLQHAHLIPFDVRKYDKATREYVVVRTDVNLIIGYPGYIDLIYRSDTIKDIHCDVVWPGDEFSYEYGSDAHLKHRPGRAPHPKDMQPEFAYMHARTKHGGEIFEVMTAADVLTIRGRSQGYRSAMASHDDAVKKGWDPMKSKAWTEAPWVKDPIPMWRKTALRAGQKWLPKSIEIAAAFSIDEHADRDEIDFSKVIDGSVVMEGGYEQVADETDRVDMSGEAFGMRGGDAGAGEQEQTKVTVDAGKPAEQTQQQQTQEKPRSTRQATARKPAAPQETKQAAPANEPPPADESEYAGAGLDEPVDDGSFPGDRPSTGTALKKLNPETSTHHETLEQTRARVAEDQRKYGVAEGERDLRQPAPTTVADYYLCDESGEPVDGDDGWTNNPVVFGERFIARWRKSTNREALVENNADAIADARKADREAVVVLSEMERRPAAPVETAARVESTPAEEDPAKADDNSMDWTVLMPTNPKGAPFLAGYVAAVKTSLARVTRPEQMADWVAANHPTYSVIPKSTRTVVEVEINSRRTQIGMGTQAAGAAPAAQQQGNSAAAEPASTPPARDVDRLRAGDLLQEIAECKTLNAITLLSESTRVITLLDRWQRERIELFDEIRQAATDKRNALRAGA